MDSASEHMLEQEEKIMHAKQTAVQLLQQLKEADAEIEVLKAKIKQLQSLENVYTPVKGDEVDCALADYLNSYEDKSAL